MEMLSEHTLEGWLEGYVLTGRHGFFSTYEAFVHVIDSMFNQHAKWLDKCSELSWRADIASLNLLITSTVWRQDHNGFTHQDPGFLDVVANKSPEVTRIYLPPDANCLLSVADHCLRSSNYVNVIVADKQPHLSYLGMDAAAKHCAKGAGIWRWASSDQDAEPDLVMASCGDIATMEALAATAMLREHFPELKVRFVNVVDLFRLVPDTEHPHGFSDREFDALFTSDKPVIFNFHAYPWLIHRLTYRRTNHDNIHVRGYKEKGNINTPMELAIQNQVDRFTLAIDVIDRVPFLRSRGSHAREALLDKQLECRRYAHAEGIDPRDRQLDMATLIDWRRFGLNGICLRHAVIWRSIPATADAPSDRREWHDDEPGLAHHAHERLHSQIRAALREGPMDEMTKASAAPRHPGRSGDDAVRLSGEAVALFERHLRFDNVVDPAAAGTRDRVRGRGPLRCATSSRSAGSRPSRPMIGRTRSGSTICRWSS